MEPTLQTLDWQGHTICRGGKGQRENKKFGKTGTSTNWILVKIIQTGLALTMQVLFVLGRGFYRGFILSVLAGN